MKKVRTYSLKKLFTGSFLIIILTTILSLFFLTSYSLWTNYKQIQYSNNASLNIYTADLKHELNNLLTLNESLYASNRDFKTLTLTNVNDSDRFHAESNLHSLIRDRAPAYGAIIIFDQSNRISMYHYGTDYPVSSTFEFNLLKEELKEYWRSAELYQFYSWTLYETDDYALLMNTYRLDNMYVCSFVDLERFTSRWNDMNTDEHLQIAFLSQDNLLTNTAYIEQIGLTIEDIRENSTSRIPFSMKYIVQTNPIPDTAVSICCILPIHYLWRYSGVSLLIGTAVFLILGTLIAIIFYYLRRLMLYPLHQIAAATELLQQNQTDHFSLSSESPALELQKINTALNELLTQKISLERDNLIKQRETDHAQLQYFQLQTRSHFFINCLKSLYNMLEGQEYERMQRMIIAFSNHLRYIFHDNLALVPLRAEFEEVQDYYSIIQMDSLVPVLLSVQSEDMLLDYKVPPLIIQTFLENSVKYSGRTENALKFTVQVDIISLDNKEFLRIRTSDNGIGYSKDILEKLNAGHEVLYEKYHIGISNLRKRTQLIYGTDIQLVFFNHPSGGACSLICLPLTKD